MHNLNWGSGWVPVAEKSGLQAELDRELAPKHPLSNARPVVIGRCLACDDVVTAVASTSDPELAVVHLTWSGRAEQVAPNGQAWPYFERVTVDEFVMRFVEGGEHL